MKRIVLRRALVATVVVVLLALGGTLLALNLGEPTSADTRRRVVPTVRTMVSYDGSESEAIMGAANEAVRRFQVWIGQLEQEGAAQASPPEEPAG
jgi:hypothetical protein